MNPSKTYTCAIFQMEAVHEEVIPSIIKPLNALGIKPVLYINEKCFIKRGDIFSEMPELNFECHYIELTSKKHWSDLANKVKESGYSFLMMTTYQRDARAAWLDQFDLPVVGMVHNTKLFLDSTVCRNVLASGKSRLLCLAPHVAAKLCSSMPEIGMESIGVVESVYWGGGTTLNIETSRGVPHIAIPGGVNFSTREFEGLIDVLANDKELASKLCIDILGGGKDRAELEDLVKSNDLSESFEFAPIGPSGQVLYNDYISKLLSADFLHPLLPISYAPYRESKITSAIPTAVAFALPILLDRWTSWVYRIPSITVGSGLKESLIYVSKMERKEVASLREKLKDYQKVTLERNESELRRILGEFIFKI